MHPPQCTMRDGPRVSAANLVPLGPRRRLASSSGDIVLPGTDVTREPDTVQSQTRDFTYPTARTSPIPFTNDERVALIDRKRVSPTYAMENDIQLKRHTDGPGSRVSAANLVPIGHSRWSPTQREVERADKPPTPLSVQPTPGERFNTTVHHVRWDFEAHSGRRSPDISDRFHRHHRRDRSRSPQRERFEQPMHENESHNRRYYDIRRRHSSRTDLRDFRERSPRLDHDRYESRRSVQARSRYDYPRTADEAYGDRHYNVREPPRYDVGSSHFQAPIHVDPRPSYRDSRDHRWDSLKHTCFPHGRSKPRSFHVQAQVDHDDLHRRQHGRYERDRDADSSRDFDEHRHGGGRDRRRNSSPYELRDRIRSIPSYEHAGAVYRDQYAYRRSPTSSSYRQHHRDRRDGRGDYSREVEAIERRKVGSRNHNT
ncbi:hypothetical protein CC80DRAFT_583933 [Byssothecium circinans]|uniref:Uncharacterized protein n=1 Tax=Byssothecium circinans TaxID=147558 RepID=A0A6A5U9E4_9PLEO|nr:hypothetical protein CC80DRAFT_583933 [Byssothecium circinans]